MSAYTDTVESADGTSLFKHLIWILLDEFDIGDNFETVVGMLQVVVILTHNSTFLSFWHNNRSDICECLNCYSDKDANGSIVFPIDFLRMLSSSVHENVTSVKTDFVTAFTFFCCKNMLHSEAKVQ